MRRPPFQHGAPDTRERSKALGRRGYLLPVCLLLIIVVGLVSTQVLDRQASAASNARRQYESYLEHHAAVGIQQAVTTWLATRRATQLEGLLGENGHAFDLFMEDGARLEIYLEPGQSQVLANLGDIDPDDVPLAATVLQQLNATTQTPKFVRLTRSVGPFEIDARYAEREVLTAVGLAVTGDLSRAERFTDELWRIRRALTRITINRAMDDAGIDDEIQRDAITDILVTDSELWRVTVQLYRGLGTGELVSSYSGLTSIQSTGSNLARSGSVQGGFWTWERQDFDQQTQEDEYKIDTRSRLAPVVGTGS